MHVLALLLFAAPAAVQDADLVKPKTTKADIAAGAKTFRSHCAACHGYNAEGARGPNLSTGQFNHASTDAELLRVISDGVPGTEMPGLFYSPDRVWQIVAYLRSLNNRPKGKGNAARGEAVYKANGCSQCHLISGEGGRLGPDLTHIGSMRAPEHLEQAIVTPNSDVRQRYWVVKATDRAGRSYEGFLMNEDTYDVQFMDLSERLQRLSKSGLTSYSVEKTSKMPSYKDRLNPTELADLVAYLSGLRSTGGSK
jgi:putative heme-binding domain-containing protein